MAFFGFPDVARNQFRPTSSQPFDASRKNMSVHPVHASYCHVIECGIYNCQRHLVTKNNALMENELWHLQEVARILDDFLLHSHDKGWDFDSEHDRYWNEIRPKYISKADEFSIWEHYNGWSFLAHATRGNEFSDLLDKEQEKIRQKFLSLPKEKQTKILEKHQNLPQLSDKWFKKQS